jgi:predicted ATPase
MKQFANYQIDKTVYTDDKYIIYQAQDSEQHKSVYLKALKAEFPDLKDVARLQRENNLIRQLNSNEIIKTLGIIRQGHQVAMVMESVTDGITLHDYCKGHAVDLHEFLTIAIQIVQGLMALNECRIIHKNLNPSNIVFSKKDQCIKIIDFGLSTQSLKENSEIASHSISTAALPYISPEHTGWGNTDLDYRADFYSLGCTFYEMLTGSPPFSAEKKTDYFKQHISQKPKPAHEINPEVPEVISNIIDKLLEKSPENRYQSSYGIYKDLLKFQGLDTKAGISWSFPLAEDDIIDRFIISNKLYGREKEISLLKQEMMQTIEKNKLGLITVTGFAGVGKTALIKTLEQQIKLNNGIFVGGKFDQYQRELPYHALSQAFEEIINHTMQSEEKNEWQKKITDSLGKNGQIIADLVPQLKNILGDLPPLPDLGPKESYNRFLATINQFIQIFSKPNHPLVIFIDDLQWATIASFNLLRDIVERNTNSALILIFSFRSNEIDAGHPLSELLSSIQQVSPINKIELLPLKKEDINKIVADTLHSHQKGCEDLSDIIYERSAGNPFFADELLTNLHEQRFIEFDYPSAEWHWDIKKIQSVRTSDNVVEFMITRLLQLPATTLDLLKKAACIGNRFDSQLLANVVQCDREQLRNYLEPALKAQVLVSISGDHTLEGAYDGRTIETQIESATIYRFQHDRIQQATYEMIDTKEKPAIHLLIGKTMLNTYSKQEVDDKVVSIANHMNKAKILILEVAEKLSLSELNLAAGIKAKASIAYQTAYEFLKTGISLLTSKSWEDHYELSYNLYEHFSQSAFLCGEFSDAESSNETLLTHAHTLLEKATIYRMRAIQYTINDKSEAALDACIDGLNLLGIKTNKKATTFTVIKELLRVKLRQGFKPISQLADLPIMQNPEKIVCMQLLMEMTAPCYTLGHKNLFAETILRQVGLAIRYGNTKESPYAYATHGLLLNAIFNQPKAGFEFGSMAIKLNENLGDISLRCRILFVFYSFIFPWNRPIRELYNIYEDIISIGYQSGDLIYVTYSTHLCLMLPPKTTIENHIELGNKYIEMVSDTKYKIGLMVLEVLQQFKLSLQDRENSKYFKINSKSEEKFLENIKSIKYDALITVYLIKKLVDNYLFSDYEMNYDMLNETEKSLEAMLSSIITEEFYVFAALTLSKLHYKANKKEKKKLFNQMNGYYKKVKKWSDHCEINFLQHALLLEANLLQMKGKYKKAASAYENALSAAQKNSSLNDEALICEETAIFYSMNNNIPEMEKYMRQAHYSYLAWGALAKVQQLESAHDFLRANPPEKLPKI